jgi:hypothetical protein
MRISKARREAREARFTVRYKIEYIRPKELAICSYCHDGIKDEGIYEITGLLKCKKDAWILNNRTNINLRFCTKCCKDIDKAILKMKGRIKSMVASVAKWPLRIKYADLKVYHPEGTIEKFKILAERKKK